MSDYQYTDVASVAEVKRLVDLGSTPHELVRAWSLMLTNAQLYDRDYGVEDYRSKAATVLGRGE